MTTIVDNRMQYGAMGYEAMGFTNPWGERAQAQVASHLYHMPHNGMQVQQPLSRPASISMPYVNNSAQSIATDMMQPPRAYTTDFSPITSTPQSYAPTSTAQYSPEYANSVASYGYDDGSRRASYQFKQPQSSRNSFSEQVDASRGMLAMSQDITPRNVYGFQNSRTASQDGYGFPTSVHSHHSSISSASTYPSYYNGSYAGSVDGSSVTDYGSSAEDILGARTLPAPGQLVGAFPPEPSSMMGQFNSKASPVTQKKHKCKLCEKRFTRPSSLATHMYSHTGEKPYACEVQGCGRHFSVVSNLRRHRKVHQGDTERDEHDQDKD